MIIISSIFFKYSLYQEHFMESNNKNGNFFNCHFYFEEKVNKISDYSFLLLIL